LTTKELSAVVVVVVAAAALSAPTFGTQVPAVVAAALDTAPAGSLMDAG
jgi:hypothetical protein